MRQLLIIRIPAAIPAMIQPGQRAGEAVVP